MTTLQPNSRKVARKSNLSDLSFRAILAVPAATPWETEVKDFLHPTRNLCCDPRMSCQQSSASAEGEDTSLAGGAACAPSGRLSTATVRLMTAHSSSLRLIVSKPPYLLLELVPAICVVREHIETGARWC